MFKNLFLVLLLFNVSFANTGSTNEGGARFGQVNFDDLKKNQKTMIEILKEMLKVQKEQLITQNKILEVLKNEYDPTPETITLADGTTCLANSSAKCFKMPLTPTAKRIPVMGQWVSEPTKENAKEYLKWQAKYVQQITKSGKAFELAGVQWGKEASPLSSRGSTTSDNLGSDYSLDKKARIAKIETLKDDIMIYLFVGKNANLDLFSLTEYYEAFRLMENVELTIVFYNESSKKALEREAKKITSIKLLFKRANSMIVSEKLFDKHSIYTTPTMGLYQYPKDKYDGLLIGKVSTYQIMSKIYTFLEYEDLIGYGDVMTYDSWEDHGSDQIKKHYQHYYDYSSIKIDDINEEYKQGVKNEK
ncbi:MAG: Unknown protein [uncultured Campylobacterales bacterium]|uniref:Uncharacterized protein n=1 Tax=uncultured Campylobacterales bacterium TaxID=352960 RepID=A0A6S6SS87_9BACT|nr:MAG: Unknown protein [uncultured Campylobacterales bacterium]